MYAVIKTGGKQYRVAADDVIEVEKVDGDAGSMISFDNVMMLGGDGAPTVGSPLVEGASVSAEVLDQKRARKIIVFKKKRRQNYRRKNGHRQELTRVKILEVLAKGQKTSRKPADKAVTDKVETGQPVAAQPEAKAAEGDAAVKVGDDKSGE